MSDATKELRSFRRDGPLYREWIAWRAMCHELDAVGINVDDPKYDRFVKALKLWGEWLVALRGDEPEHIESAMDDATADYDLDAAATKFELG